MPSKQKTRRRPAIHEIQRFTRSDSTLGYVLCRGQGCRNVVAIWAKQMYCSRCRKGE